MPDPSKAAIRQVLGELSEAALRSWYHQQSKDKARAAGCADALNGAASCPPPEASNQEAHCYRLGYDVGLWIRERVKEDL